MNRPYIGNEVRELVKGYHPTLFPNRSSRRGARRPQLSINNRKPTRGRLTVLQKLATYVDKDGRLVSFKNAVKKKIKVTFAGYRNILHKNYQRFCS